MSEKEISLLLDKARASSQINETDMPLLFWLIYHEDRTDFGYRLKRRLKSLNTKLTIRASHSIKVNLIKPTFLHMDLFKNSTSEFAF